MNLGIKIIICASMLLVFFMPGCKANITRAWYYNVEIALSDKRPDLKKDIGFIVYGTRYSSDFGWDTWGYHLYKKAIDANNLSKVFLCPNLFCKSIPDFSSIKWIDQYQKACEPYIIYPTNRNTRSFYDMDLSVFTNSFKKCFAKKDKQLTLEKGFEKTKRDRVDFGGGTAIDDEIAYRYACHISANVNADTGIDGQMVEHTLEALFLKRRFTKVRSLYEHCSRYQRTMAINGECIPTRRYSTTTMVMRYELWTDDGDLAGCVTVSYPFYSYMVHRGLYNEPVEQEAMTKFISFFCDRSIGNAKYEGVVTHRIAYPRNQEMGSCKFRNLKLVDTSPIKQPVRKLPHPRHYKSSESR